VIRISRQKAEIILVVVVVVVVAVVVVVDVVFGSIFEK
jgi:hypothetical protein